MRQVDYFRTEVKYTGRFEDYSMEDWKAMARAKEDRCGCGCFFETRDEADEFAEVIDGKYFVKDEFPCNKIAVVMWAYAVDEDEEEE